MRLTKRSRSRGLFFCSLNMAMIVFAYNVMNMAVFLAFCVVVYMQVRVFVRVLMRVGQPVVPVLVCVNMHVRMCVL